MTIMLQLSTKMKLSVPELNSWGATEDENLNVSCIITQMTSHKLNAGR
jgi:hypothetical protein